MFGSKYIYMILLCIFWGFACDSSDSEEMMAGEEMAGEMMAGEMMAGEMMVDLPIIGEFMDDFMTSHVITADTWTQTYVGDDPSIFYIRSVNTDAQYLIAENDEMNAFSPSLWSRMDWAYVNDELWFCQGVFDAESAESAEDSVAPDSANPAMGGCGMFSWSKLTLQ